MSLMTNPILRSDSYKFSHYLQDVPGTTRKRYYITARKNNSGSPATGVIFRGLSYYLQQHLSTPITMDDVLEAEEFILAHGLPFNREGWVKIVEEYDGVFPVEILAVPEGTFVPFGMPMVIIENLDPELPWLGGWIETLILQSCWYSSTVTTNSWYIKQDLKKALEKSGSSLNGLEFMLHDFGYRGVSTQESAGVGGAAHLVNFKGTDNVAGIVYAKEYYKAAGMPGLSVIAAEHSTVTPWGHERSDEKRCYENLIDIGTKDGGIVSIVADSFNLQAAVEDLFCRELKSKIENCGGRVVVRPDSGDPKEIPVWVLETLLKNYNYTYNEKGYKVLPDCIRVIQGDGISRETIQSILASLEEKRISPENIVFGMGGKLLQDLSRDTFSFAMKCCSATINGEEVDVRKDPKTDPSKRSLGGNIVLIRNDTYDSLDFAREDEIPEGYSLAMECYFNLGIQKLDTFQEIQRRANEALK